MSQTIHVTGVQRSGHNFIAKLIETVLFQCWSKQQGEPWEFHFTDSSSGNLLRFDFPEGLGLSIDSSALPSTLMQDGIAHDVSNAAKVRITEYREPEWFVSHVLPVMEKVQWNINVVRDPRNVLASAACHHKDWSVDECSRILDGCEFQYTAEVFNKFLLISYDELVRDIISASKSGQRLEFIRGWASSQQPASITIPEEQHKVVTNITGGGWKNTSFAATGHLHEQLTRYQMPEVLDNPKFQKLISRAEDIYRVYHMPFIEKLNKSMNSDDTSNKIKDKRE